MYCFVVKGLLFVLVIFNCLMNDVCLIFIFILGILFESITSSKVCRRLME